MDPSKKEPTSLSQPPVTNLSPPAEVVDVTDEAVAAETAQFQVNDRVERLFGNSENARWGTITEHVRDDERGDWLVIDNDGITHRDRAADLAPAIRGRERTKPRKNAALRDEAT